MIWIDGEHGIEAKRTKNKVVTNKNKVFVTTLKNYLFKNSTAN